MIVVPLITKLPLTGASVSPAESSIAVVLTAPPMPPLLTRVVADAAGIVNVVPLMVNVPAVGARSRPAWSSGTAADTGAPIAEVLSTFVVVATPRTSTVKLPMAADAEALTPR
ncbi:MAG: hypothetical protein U0360_02715 [Dehalococcoidia bacterium]